MPPGIVCRVCDGQGPDLTSLRITDLDDNPDQQQRTLEPRPGALVSSLCCRLPREKHRGVSSTVTFSFMNSRAIKALENANYEIIWISCHSWCLPVRTVPRLRAAGERSAY